MTEPLARVVVVESDGVVVLEVHGEIDLSNADHLQREIEAAVADAESAVLIDLDDVQYIDSQGLRLLHVVMRSSTTRGLQVAMVASPGSVAADVLALTGIACYPTRDAIDR